MRVLLVRHGAAVDPYMADTDAQRWLTPEGRANVRAVGSLLGAEGVRFDHVMTSPLVRAVQTGQILTEQLGFDGPVTVWPGLAGGTTAQALAPLEEQAPATTLAMVGHEPLIRVMAAHLTGFREFPGFRTAMAVMIALDDPSPRFDWLIDPKALRRVDDLTSIPR